MTLSIAVSLADLGMDETEFRKLVSRIDDAVVSLDPFSDAQWNAQGLPKLKAVEAVLRKVIRLERSRFPALMLTRDYWAIEHGENKKKYN